MAPEKIENIYISSVYVAQAYIYGDSLKAACIGIIVPDEEVLMRWTKNNGIEGSLEEVCKTQVHVCVRGWVCGDVSECGWVGVACIIPATNRLFVEFKQ